MGEAREVMDRLTDAVFRRDRDAVARLYASDAVLVAPDAGEIQGTEEVVAWSTEFLDAFPDARYESLYAHESGNTAIDEGYFVGTKSSLKQTAAYTHAIPGHLSEAVSRFDGYLASFSSPAAATRSDYPTSYPTGGVRRTDMAL